MRTWTLVVSVCVHGAAIAAVLVAPLFADTALPEPRRPLTFEPITIIDPPEPAPVRPTRDQSSAATSVVPIDEPHDLPPIDAPTPEPARAAVADVPESGRGIVSFGLVPGHEPTAPPVAPPREPMRVGGVIETPTRVFYVSPVYPPIAIAARIQGTVILEAVLDEQGMVRNLKVLRSIPLLDQAAIQAVSKWRFTPTLLNGAPVPVVMTVTVGFKLTQ